MFKAIDKNNLIDGLQYGINKGHINKEDIKKFLTGLSEASLTKLIECYFEYDKELDAAEGS